MAKGVRQTVIEKQTMIYGQFQSEIRKMDKGQRDQYAMPGTPEHDRHLAKVAAYQKRYNERKAAIAAFEKEVPQFGSFKGMTAEEAAASAIRRTEIMDKWNTKRKQFMEDLDKRLPALEV